MDGSLSDLHFHVPQEKRSRLSKIPPPLWATWSMNAAQAGQWKSKNEKSNERLAKVLNGLGLLKDQKALQNDTHWSKFSIKSMLQDGSDSAIHASDWKPFYEDESTEIGRELGKFNTGHIDQGQVSELSLEVAKVQRLVTDVLEDPGDPFGNVTPEMLEMGYFDYSPLLPIEQERIQRFLRLTGYKPAPLQRHKSDHELLRESYRQSLTSTSKELSQLEEQDDPLEISRKIRQRRTKLINEKYNTHVEFRQERQQFINMCRMTLPTRHTDWILQKVFEDSQKDVKESPIIPELGQQIKKVPDLKESVSTEEAIEMVKNETLPFENAAIVMHALASASNVRTKDIILSKKYSIEGGVQARQKQRNFLRRRTESVAMARAMKVLFPHFFQEQGKETAESTEAEASIQAALNNIRTIKSSKVGKRKKRQADADQTIRIIASSRASKRKKRLVDAGLSTSREASSSHQVYGKNGRVTKSEAERRRIFRERQTRLTQKLYYDSELQSEEDEQYESGDNDGAELDDEDDVPFDGILDLQNWLEHCNTKSSYKLLRDHVSEVYDGEIPSWIEERLDPRYKKRFLKRITDEEEQGTNVEKDLDGLPKNVEEKAESGPKKEARISERKELEENLRKKFEQAKALKNKPILARLEQQEKFRQQAEIERREKDAEKRARKERRAREGEINAARISEATELQCESVQKD